MWPASVSEMLAKMKPASPWNALVWLHLTFCVSATFTSVNVSEAGTGSYSFLPFPLRAVIKNTVESKKRFWQAPFLVGNVPARWPWLSHMTLLGLTLLYCWVGILQSTWQVWREDCKHSPSCHSPSHWAHLTSRPSLTGGQATRPQGFSWRNARHVLAHRPGALGAEGCLRPWGKPLIAWTQHQTHEPRLGH